MKNKKKGYHFIKKVELADSDCKIIKINMFKKIEGEKKDRKHKRNYREFHKIYISIKGKEEENTLQHGNNNSPYFTGCCKHYSAYDCFNMYVLWVNFINY